MRLRYDIRFRRVGRKYIGVTVLGDEASCPGFLLFNETGRDIAARLQQETSREELIAALLRDYDTSAEVITPCVDEVLAYLKERRVLC